MGASQYTIGLDFGSDSVRALVVNVDTGEEVCTAVSNYKRWAAGQYCIPHKNQFRQHPKDYIESMIEVVNAALDQTDNDVREGIIGIGVDTTGSTPCPVDGAGIPLALTAGFEENPNAMFHLWKDHTAINEAAEINEKNKDSDVDYLKYVGGIYSSEWFWAKIIHTNRADEDVRNSAYTWVEHCDWIPFMLTGGSDATEMKRSVCAAGHKALWHQEFEGMPSKDFLTKLDSSLANFKIELLKEAHTSDEVAGSLNEEWADKLGLSSKVVVAVGAYDAHMGAVGGEIESGFLSKVIGTSTCDIMVAPLEPNEHLVKGICGQVNGSVIPGMLGLEAGQSAFGDVYAWFKQLLVWPLKYAGDSISEAAIKEISDAIIPNLAKEAEQIAPETDDAVVLDWLNGRRSPDADQSLKGVLSGLNLGTDAPRVFKSLVEATCFGARKITERFDDEGVEIKGVIALGGVAKKSAYVMQTLSDVLQMPIKVGKSEQTCALGAAMFAAVAAGKYNRVEEAMKNMGAGFEKTYQPNKARVDVYNHLYARYCNLGAAIESIEE
ncbi:MAG: ribulokinase [Flavobacteriales bacterium]|nr:ribulokinase [Flavobacteriales bacterium]